MEDGGTPACRPSGLLPGNGQRRAASFTTLVVTALEGLGLGWAGLGLGLGLAGVGVGAGAGAAYAVACKGSRTVGGGGKTFSRASVHVILVRPRRRRRAMAMANEGWRKSRNRQICNATTAASAAGRRAPANGSLR
ncbi:hypothetical protein Mp_8g14920 [Marchantia polymorpha subsp. ruderalis]|uniref:Uncharacterized protein n=1 Tax=Marchantia polymorpha TaxID=3197 RepID=A0A2R6W517_MARPO|nr:hypothetical protein MARPO_0151s0014 [Marchantia polymorpha]BBN19924.1 hypothetical protein Mp_8g14920 [Marchantia polymorpha subsp. ruderalis]|eukprot:PTQ28940.1 hypothetical protein MARPO_0151s0014 [Marchantia polymorpha]